MTVKIAPLSEQHLQAVWCIESTAHSHPWSKTLINDIQSRGACNHVLLKDNIVVGYFYAQNIAAEMTLLNIAIDPKVQGQGLGKVLMTHFLTLCQQQNVETVWLEVRESNHKARTLYESIGFNEVDRRRNYYPAANGREDAIIMSYLFF